MSTTPVSNPLFRELQSFQSRAAETRQAAAEPQAAANPAFVVTITGSQGQAVDGAKQDFWRQREAGLDQLGSVLQSGDTAAAQQAFDSLVALGQSGPLKNGAAFHRTDRAADFAAIGQALQSGDLAGAQQAFAALENSFNSSTTTLLGPPTPAPGQIPPGPPTPAPIPSAVPPQGTLPPGPPTPAPVPLPTSLPPHGSPAGPPTFVSPPSIIGGGPSGPPDVIGNSTASRGHGRHRALPNPVHSQGPANGGTVSIKA